MRKHEAKLERDFQRSLVSEIENKFRGCFVMKNDASRRQGIPDLLILYKDKWAALEVKKSAKEMDDLRPNQGYYVEKMDEMSFARFIYPENKKEVMDDLQQALES